MQTVFLDKQERLRRWLTPKRALATGLSAAVLLLVPLWHESVPARFFVEPGRRAVLRSEVPGTVAEVFVREGDHVSSGMPIARLRNLDLESRASRARSDLSLAAARLVDAQLHYGNIGAAEQDHQQLTQSYSQLEQQIARLDVRSPLSGTITTPRLADLAGLRVVAGAEIAEIADLSNVRVRLFIPESEMRDVREGQPVSLKVDSLFSRWSGTVSEIAPASTEMESGLQAKLPYKGLQPPRYYSATVLEKNDQGLLRYGMTGTARIYTARRSLLGLVWRPISDFIGRKIW